MTCARKYLILHKDKNGDAINNTLTGTEVPDGFKFKEIEESQESQQNLNNRI